MSRHSWEAPEPERESVSASENESEFTRMSDSDDDTRRATPADELISYCRILLLSRTITYKDLCIIMWWAGKAGVHEAVRLGHNPDAPSGHFARHVKATLGVFNETEHMYQFDIPGHAKADLSRSLHSVTTFAPHELLASDVVASPSLRVQLDEAVADHQLPLAYYTHPVVQASADARVWPISIFIDGVPYSHTDSVVGWWLVNMVSGQRYLFACLRKRTVCKCGCRGWCSFYAMLRYVAWCLAALAEGTWPARRHDRKPWQPTDEARATKAGTPLGVKAALIHIKGDWMEFATTLGLPSWNDGLRPCFACNADRDSFHTSLGAGPLVFPFRENQEGDYELACQRCEFYVVIPDQGTHRQIRGLLVYDKRNKAAGVELCCRA